jgi:hypothetical protein
MALFSSTPTYFGTGTKPADCKTRERGLFSWIRELLGFPSKTPCYFEKDIILDDGGDGGKGDCGCDVISDVQK